MRRLFLCVLACIPALVQAQYNNIYTESAWKERDKWQKPERIIRAMNISAGDVVADVGSHEGYMSVRLAQYLGAGGQVYAVDVNTSRLDQLKRHLSERELTNTKLIHGDYDNPRLPVNTFDAILILDTYHEMDDYKEILRHCKRALKPTGRLVIIEPIADERKSWSRDRQTARHEIAIRYVEKEVKNAGFKVLEKDDMFLDRTEEKGDKLWMLILTY